MRVRVRDAITRWCTDSAVNLAVMRVSVGAVVLAMQEIHTLSVEATRLPLAVRTPPAGWHQVMRAVPVTPALAEGLRAVVLVSALTGTLGLFSRTSFAALTLAGAVLWAQAMTLGSAIHLHHLLWLSALLAVSPCGDAISLDRKVFHRASGAPSVAYGLPLRTAWMLLGAVYFFPGLWKLRTSGLQWVLSDNLLLHMRAKWFQMQGFAPLFRVDRFPWLCRVGAGLTVAFELSFWLLVIPRRTRALAVVVALLFHQATDAFMGLRYPALWCTYALFFDLRRPLGRFFDVTETPGLQRDVRVTGVVAAGLLAGAVTLGVMGESDAWPFACYPKFDRLGPTALPVLEVVAVTDAGEVPVPDRAMFPAGRTQRYWALTWSLMGAHRSERASNARFAALWSSVGRRAAVRAVVGDARAVRFYRALASTDPDHPAVRGRVLLGEITVTRR